MARRRINEEPISQTAVWARRTAIFAFVAALLSIVIVKSEILEVKPALATFAGSLVFAVVAILLAFASFVVIWRQGTEGFGSALFALFIGTALLAYPAYLARQAYKLPAITDIVTDPDDPPRFEKSARQRDDNPIAYPGPAVAEKQRAAYPDVEPLIVTSTPQQAYEAAFAIMTKRKWSIIVDTPPAVSNRRDGRGGRDGRIEAVARTPIMGFREDVVLRVRPDGEGARIDVRSSSRFGPHDLGSNASRITKLLDEIDETLGVQAERRAAKRPAPAAAKPAPVKR